HFSVVKNIEVRYSPGRLIIGVDSNNEKADLELWTCERRTDLLSRLLDRRVLEEGFLSCADALLIKPLKPSIQPLAGARGNREDPRFRHHARESVVEVPDAYAKMREQIDLRQQHRVRVSEHDGILERFVFALGNRKRD